MLAFTVFTVLGATTIYAGWLCYNTVNVGCDACPTPPGCNYLILCGGTFPGGVNYQWCTGTSPGGVNRNCISVTSGGEWICDGLLASCKPLVTFTGTCCGGAMLFGNALGSPIIQAFTWGPDC